MARVLDIHGRLEHLDCGRCPVGQDRQWRGCGVAPAWRDEEWRPSEVIEEAGAKQDRVPQLAMSRYALAVAGGIWRRLRHLWPCCPAWYARHSPLAARLEVEPYIDVIRRDRIDMQRPIDETEHSAASHDMVLLALRLSREIRAEDQRDALPGGRS